MSVAPPMLFRRAMGSMFCGSQTFRNLPNPSLNLIQGHFARFRERLLTLKLVAKAQRRSLQAAFTREDAHSSKPRALCHILSCQLAKPSESSPRHYGWGLWLWRPSCPRRIVATAGPGSKISIYLAALPAGWKRLCGGSWGPRCCGLRVTRVGAASATARASIPTMVASS